ncbi:hypothetical protein BJY01DRAFT_234076 [Aspergillus pseudoustus]|uniref:Pentacotripeptide-repeat region of PRORP domain-containing protein n=1 Tax=Aspergillus pseudoustus TaxID=1810923 RepID=A0ABR4K705_9EURO
MLERTAGCIESAGRRFLRGPGQNVCAISDYSHWQLAPRRALRNRHPDTISIPAITDPRPPFLHFLYPAGTQEFIVTRLLRSSRSILSRRKRRSVPAGTRSYTSDTTTRRPATTSSSVLKNRQEALAKSALVELLNKGIGSQPDRAWELWVAADQPCDLNRSLLAQLSKSENQEDYTRAKSVFQSISPEQRSGDDYLHLINSTLTTGHADELKRICEDALKNNGLTHWASILAHFVNNSEWSLAAHIWAARFSLEMDEEKLMTGLESLLISTDKMSNSTKHSGPFLNTSSLVANFVDLSRALEHSMMDPEASADAAASLHSLAGFLVDSIFLSRAFIERLPSQTLSSLAEAFHSAALIGVHHCYEIMQILLDAQTQSDIRRAVTFFQDCRSLMSDDDPPPVQLLDYFLKRTIDMRMTDSIEYFLEQYTQFGEKPGLKRYRAALVGLARTGDVAKVHRVFEEMVSHYGKPNDSGSLAPILNVHACVGDVDRTLAEFEKISNNWGFVPGTICWNITLTAYAKRGDLKGCADRFTMMTKANVPPNSHTFGILLGLCGKRASAKESRVQLTTAMLDPVVEAYCKMKDLEMAERVAEDCLNLNVTGSRTRMWNVILWAYAHSLDLESISRIRSRMVSAGIIFDDMTYTALTLSLTLAGEIESAHSLIKSLQQNHKVHLTETQYTILLLGYVKQNNRDMGPQGSLSEEIQGLRRQIQRDLMTMHIDKTPDAPFKFTEKFLHEIISKRGPIIVKRDDNTFGPDEPQHPHRMEEEKRLFGATEAAEKHLHPFRAMMSYARKGTLMEVEKIWQDYVTKKGCPDSYDHAPFRMLVTFMIAYMRVDAHEKVDQFWKMAYLRALKMALPLDSTQVDDQIPSTDVTSSPVSSVPGNNYKSVLVSGDAQTEDEGLLPRYTSRILPIYRFALTRHLSAYMWSLAGRGEISKIKQLIADVEEAGFSLTTFNWSTYVQVLTRSDEHTHTVEAFKIFEERFMPNFPGSWKNLLKSRGFKHSGVTDDIHLLDGSLPSDILRKTTKKYWLKQNPDYMQPTFVSLFQLSNAILRTRERSISAGMAEIQELYKVAPRTIDQLGKYPFLREHWRAWRQLLDKRGQHSGPKRVITKQRIGRTKKRIFRPKNQNSDMGRYMSKTNPTEFRDFNS